MRSSLDQCGFRTIRQLLYDRHDSCVQSFVYFAGLAVLALVAAGCGSQSVEPGPPRHVLLLTVDTLRSDHLSANGHDLPTTPYLDRLLAGGVAFPRTLTPVPRTTPALASLLTGAYPHTTGVRTLYDPLSDTVASLAEILSRNGFRTAAVVSNHVLTRERRLDRGFKVYDAAGDGRGARETTDAALALAGDAWRDQSVLLWVHYIDPHVPYLPPRELAEAFDPGYADRYALGFGSVPGGVGDRAYPPDLPKAEAVYRNPLPRAVNAHVRRLYAADVRTTDDEIARLVEGLKAQVKNDWLVVFTADHGESLGEHDFFWDHGDYVYNASLQVPLGFVLPPGDPRTHSARVEQWVSLVDVMPTLLDLLAIDVSGGIATQIEGRSLLPLLEGRTLPLRPIFAESGKSFYPQLVRRRVGFDVAGRFRATVLGDWKLIWTPGQAPQMEYELYDLAADPAETRNLWTAGHPRAEALADHLRAWYRDADHVERPPSAEDLERLRSLGYLE
ncbi:MAG: sulfatase [Thermoanaerobaculia bacterium]